MGVKLSDIAKRANVSLTTVSRVLNKDESFSVGKETEKKVWDAVYALGYTTNKFKDSEKKIGYILSLAKDRFQEPVFAEIISGLEQELMEKPYTLAFAYTSQDLENPHNLFQAMNTKADGVIFIGNLPDEQYQPIRQHIQHAVSIFDTHDDMNCVTVDFEKSAYKVVHDLITEGRKHIVFLGGTSVAATDYFMNTEERYQGYIKALLEAQYPIIADYICNAQWDTETGYKITMTLLNNQRIDAIFAANDRMAIGAMRAIQEAGYRIPQDIAVVGFDDIEMGSYMQPPLSTVTYPKEELGRIAVRTLINNIEGKHITGYPSNIVLSSKVVVRGTGL